MDVVDDCESLIQSSPLLNVINSKTLLQKFDVPTLLRLRKYFSYTQTNKRNILAIDEGRFVNAINIIFNDSSFNVDAVKLFQSLDVTEIGLVQWTQLLDKLIEFGKERIQYKFDNLMLIVKSAIVIEDLEHSKKETIAYIITIETQSSFCYVVISRHGKVGVYDGQFKLQLDYDVFFIRTGISRRVRDIWITAAIYLEDNKSIVITASDKSMMIYDASTLCHFPIFLITGITNVTMCMSYNPSSKNNKLSYLVLGDDLGGITTIIFKQPHVSLFYKKYQDKLNSYFWIELQGSVNENYCRVKFNRRIHTRPVKKIIHVPQNDTILSCSSDPDASIVIRHNKGIRDPYVFKIPQGVTCFSYSESLGVLATGGGDGCVRLWEPVVPQKPSAVFESQHTRIVDVVILAHLCLIISLNKNAVLKVWEIFDHKCVQSVNLRFPSFAILGKPIQFGFESIYCGAARKVKSSKDDTNETSENETEELTRKEYEKWDRPEIIVTCCNHIAKVPIYNPNLIDQELVYLPPPERTYRPKKPLVFEDDQVNADKKQLLSKSEPSLTTLKICGNTDIIMSHKNEYPTLNEMLKEIGLPGIMEKDFLGTAGLKHDMNMRLALHQAKQEKMKVPVSQGAPFTALDLHDPVEITFSLSLPLSDRMKARSGVNYFTDPQHILKYSSCFSMETPQSDYNSSSATASNNHNSRK